MKNGKDQPNDENLYANYLAQGLVGRNNLQMLVVKTSLELNYANDRLKQGRITIEEFRSIYRTIAHRKEISEIFNTYSENRKVLFEKNLTAFLRQEQYTFNISKTTISEIIQKYEPIPEGCRCLEIDCWDGSQNKPIVYHGYTLTSRLLFKTVIQAIHKYAFVTSDYPVVLSLENHCSASQQEVMADILQSVFGDTLLSDMLDDFPDKLPSPEALKLKVLVRNKKIGTLRETRERRGSDKHGQVEECEEEETDQEDEEDEVKESEAAGILKEGPDQETEKKRVVGLPLFKKRRVKVAMALSDLVIYTKAEKFRSFHRSRMHQQFNETNSIGETKARKLSKLKVALNFQTAGMPMDLQNGKFLDNGGSGYILKPQFLRDDKSNFNPNTALVDSNPVVLTIRLISGVQLPPSSHSSSNKADSSVTVEIFGVPNDQVKQQTRVIKRNAFGPRWNEAFTFIIQVPELALIRFVVENQSLIAGNEFLGQYTLPVLCMNKGYRRIPLFSRMGESLEPASLFVYVWYIRATNGA
ncbi:1-Phosphatidylinositol 4,5-Bisphosphate Phosphodiesterase Zeta-1 [Manis pentadactyla]|nr:1-Phosphatidylinositol 4,5-Bisphosphate Phosphodiesterase Zeta-1 [Manis pentadactyla]